MRLQKFKKLLCIVLTMMMVVGMMPEMNVGAENTTKKLYLKPNTWLDGGDDAVFMAYFFADGVDTKPWISMNDTDSDGIYEVEVPNGDYTHVIFCKMNNNTGNWDNVVYQTVDMQIDGAENKYCDIAGFSHEKTYKAGWVPFEMPTTIYLNPSSNWREANAWFVGYFFIGDTNTSVKATDDNTDGIYEIDVPDGEWSNVILCRMNPAASEFGWDNVWAQTGNMDIPLENCCWSNEGWDTTGVWGHNYISDICTTCGECSVTKFAGHSLSLIGNIAVSFYMGLTDDDKTGEMVFTLPNGSKKTVKADDAEYDNDKMCYVFTCEVAAKEMTADIVAEYYNGESLVVNETYTVKQYADYILENADTYANEVPVVNAMLNYGAYAQTYFKYNTNALANADLTDKAVSVEAGTLSKYAAKISANARVGTFTTANLVLKSKTEINVTFESDVEGLEFAIDNVPVEAKKSGNKYVLTVSDVSAADLNKAYTFKVTKGSDVCTLEYSAMSYAYTIFSTSDNEDLKNVVAALCLYNQAAGAYVTPTV